MTENGQITITVDGKQITCNPGDLLIEAAENAGIFIPRFCWHKRMDPVGACRMCLVNIEGSPPIPGSDKLRPQASCTTRVRDGMVVHTQYTDEDVEQAQRSILEFLLINHPLDCPICDRGGECPLQDQTLDYGPSESRYVETKRRFVKPVEISPLIKLDRERCILCYRCTRFCDELSGDTMIAVMQRGAQAYIYPFEEDIFDSYFSGNTVQICPVGALTSSTYRFAARPWDLNLQPTTCNLCAAGCAMTADVRVSDGRLVRVSARVDENTNEEWLCDKGRYGHEYVSATSRLTSPLLRKDGELQPVSWDEAFAFLTERIGAVSDPSRAAVIVGGGLCDEDAYAAQKFARVVLRTNNIDHRLEGRPDEAFVPPAIDYDTLLGSDLAVVVSSDLREELPIVFFRLRVAATKRGVRVAVVHPRRVAGLTEIASTVLQPLPGTEAAVAAALTAALGSPAAGGLESTAAAAGLAPDEVTRLAELLRDAQRPTILLGPAAAGATAVHAWSAVAAATGASIGWAPRRAGERGALAAGAHPGLLPGYRQVTDDAHRSQIAAAWGADVPDAAGLDVGGILRAGRDEALDLLWVTGADLLADVPDVALVADGLAGAATVILQDVQDTSQARFADLVLPAAAFVERSGTLTNWEGRRQSVGQAVDPPGAARGDYAIFAEVARRAGTPMGCRSIDDARAELESLLRDLPTREGNGTVTVSSPPREDGYPLRLLSYRLLYDRGSRARHVEEIGRMTQPAFVELHPDDAAAAGVTDGGTATVSSRYGSISVWVRVSDATRKGVAFVPYLQPGASAQGLMSWDDQSPAVRVEPA